MIYSYVGLLLTKYYVPIPNCTLLLINFASNQKYPTFRRNRPAAAAFTRPLPWFPQQGVALWNFSNLIIVVVAFTLSSVSPVFDPGWLSLHGCRWIEGLCEQSLGLNISSRTHRDTYLGGSNFLKTRSTTGLFKRRFFFVIWPLGFCIVLRLACFRPATVWINNPGWLAWHGCRWIEGLCRDSRVKHFIEPTLLRVSSTKVISRTWHPSEGWSSNRRPP